MAIFAAVLSSEEDQVMHAPQAMPAMDFRATHSTAIMEALHCLQKGQARLEAQLNRIEVCCSRGPPSPGQDPIAAFQPLSSTNKSAVTRIKHVSGPPSQGNPPHLPEYPQSKGRGENPALTKGNPPQLPEDLQTQGQDAVLQALEESANSMECELNQVESQKKRDFMNRHHQQMLEEQEEAREALFHARNTAKGWSMDKPVVPMEHDAAAHDHACQAGGIRLWLNEQIENGRFDMAFGLVILANAMLMLFQLQENGSKVGYEYGFAHEGVLDYVKAQEPEYHIDKIFFFVGDIVFLTIFSIELILRISIRYRTFFKHAWNYLDVLLVGMAFLAVLFSTGNLTYLRVLRLVRLTRALRVARMMRSFEPLRILVATAMQSMLSLLWAIILISLILLMATCAMVTLVQQQIEDDSVDFEVREQLWQRFGTAGHAYYTFFKWTLTTSWTTDVELLILGVNGYFGFFVFPFIIVVNFALIRVVSALFIRDTLAAGHKDTMTGLEETMKRDNQLVVQLQELFLSFDADMDGLVTKLEFDAAMVDPRVQLCLRSLEVEPHEATSLFVLLDHGMGWLSVPELIAGAMDLRHAARGQGVDLATVKYESQKTMLVVRHIEQQCGMMLRFMEYTIRHMHTVHELHDTVHGKIETARESSLQAQVVQTSQGVEEI